MTALYVHLDDHVLPWRQPLPRRGRPRTLSDAEPVCVTVAQVLLRCDDERRWLRVAPGRIGHPFPRLPCQSQYDRHLRDLGPVLSAVALWLARATPSWWDRLRLMDGTPVRCGASRVTVNRSGLGEIAGYGMDQSHHAFCWGAKLMLITTAEGAVRAFSLAHHKELDERKQALHPLHVRPPSEGAGMGLSGATEQPLALAAFAATGRRQSRLRCARVGAWGDLRCRTAQDDGAP
ncbi:hypothetical protein HNR61_008481 [Actinomadura namibiensis]|uniref:Transposase n=1 Tax=Actinomadura namibiensis TaxID=182080 RepID=A0A7W3LYR4_ACTNM|nr:hypothetical protein [Actinomadura namibiensis]MBA8956791.1 hypothetical protein [Actinomadura namibiensis]